MKNGVYLIRKMLYITSLLSITLQPIGILANQVVEGGDSDKIEKFDPAPPDFQNNSENVEPIIPISPEGQVETVQGTNIIDQSSTPRLFSSGITDIDALAQIDTNFVGDKRSTDVLTMTLKMNTSPNNKLSKGDKIEISLSSDIINYDTILLQTSVQGYFDYSLDKTNHKIILISELDMNITGQFDLLFTCNAFDLTATTKVTANLLTVDGSQFDIFVKNPNLSVIKNPGNTTALAGATLEGGLPSWYTILYPGGFYNNSSGRISAGNYGFSYTNPYHFYTLTFAVRGNTNFKNFFGEVSSTSTILKNSLYIQKMSGSGTITPLSPEQIATVNNNILTINFGDAQRWDIYTVVFAAEAKLPTEVTTVNASLKSATDTVYAQQVQGRFLGTTVNGFIPYFLSNDIQINSGDSIDFFENITAFDVEDGDLTSLIRVTDDGGFDEKKAGEYIVTYSVTDSTGNTATHQRKVTVLSEVVVTHVNENGNELISPTVLNGKLGTDYSTSAASFYAWKLKEISGNVNGTYTEYSQEVRYIYEPKEAAPVIIRYVDELNQEIHPSLNVTGFIAHTYDVSTDEYQISIEGYKLNQSELPHNLKGIFTDQEQVVTYTYYKEYQPVLEVKNLTIYVNDPWDAKFNIQKIRDRAGNEVLNPNIIMDTTISAPFKLLTSKVYVTGLVNTRKPGIYPLTYKYEGQIAEATVTVLEHEQITIFPESDTTPKDENRVSEDEEQADEEEVLNKDTIQLKKVNTDKKSSYLPKSGAENLSFGISIGGLFIILSGLLYIGKRR